MTVHDRPQVSPARGAERSIRDFQCQLPRILRTVPEGLRPQPRYLSPMGLRQGCAAVAVNESRQDQGPKELGVEKFVYGLSGGATRA
jgi:hypothetical protein